MTLMPEADVTRIVVALLLPSIACSTCHGEELKTSGNVRDGTPFDLTPAPRSPFGLH